MEKVVITGANGFIGSALCNMLSKQNIEIIAVVRNENSDISAIKQLPGLRIVYCSLEQLKNLADIISDRDIDVFYHLAWSGSAGILRGDSDVQTKNIKYTCDAVHACHQLGGRKFIFASSIMEYETERLMATENIPNPYSAYPTAKLAANYMARAAAGNCGIEYIRALISNVYGPGETSPRLINSSLRKLLSREHCAFSAGTQMYDFIYISDAAEAFYLLGKMGCANRTYYLGSPCPRPLREFLLVMRDAVDASIPIGLGELPFTGVSLTYREFDITALKKDTGFVPKVGFAEGIQKTIAWLRKENPYEHI